MIVLDRTSPARRLRFALAALLSLAALGGFGAASASASGPSLAVDSAANTTVAPDSDLNYFLLVKNLGDAPTDGSEIALTITLPAHVTAVDVFFGFDFSCTAEDGSPLPGASTVKCVTTSVLGPLDRLTLNLVVHVDGAVSDGDPLTSTLGVTGGGAPDAGTVDPTRVATTPPGFGIDAFDAGIADAAGDPFTQAAGHPDAITTAFDYNTLTNPDLTGPPPFYNQFTGDLWPVEATKDAVVDLPPGLIGDPSVLTQCTPVELTNGINGRPLCAPSSQIGTVLLRLNSAGRAGQSAQLPVFSIVPPPGVPARFGFNIARIAVMLDARVRSNGDYGLSIDARNIPDGVAIAGSSITFWGTPADHSHDPQRWCPEGTPSPCGAGVPARAFLRNPTSCTGPLDTALHLDSWFHPGAFDAAGAPDLSDPAWQSSTSTSHALPGYPWPRDQWGAPQGMTGCERVPFDPQMRVTPTSDEADSPSGIDASIELPQTSDPSVLAQSDVKKVVTTLPEGMTVNPASADGLGACSLAQLARETASSDFGSGCPASAKIGSAQIDTPLLPGEPLSGSIFLATPDDPSTPAPGAENPFDSLLAGYIVAKSAERGIVVRLPGLIEANPDTGRLTATFDNNPQLPFDRLELHFKSGNRAPLATPPTCGQYEIASQLFPWSGNPPVSATDSFTVAHGPGGGPCVAGDPAQPADPADRADLPFHPGLSAGTQNPSAGAYSPFVLRLTRTDGEQELTRLSADLPPGVLGKLAGVSQCSDATLASIPSAVGTGRAEANSPSCPANSQVGRTEAGAGSGPTPFYLGGKVYLAGPYKGAPLSLAIVAPALAGPFDLGNVVVRSALAIDRDDAQIHVQSDPIPTILHGIPLHLRDVRVVIDRPDFTLNPTNCSPMAVSGQVSGAGADLTEPADDGSAPVSDFFQVRDCGALKFKPKLHLRLSGHTNRNGHPALRSVLAQAKGQANIASAQVTLPPSELLDNAHIGSVCTRVQYAAGQGGGEQCPPGSLLGHARATTPLLDQPLEGAVYLRSSSHQLPDLVASLNGQIHLDLDGRIDSSKRGGLRTTFEGIPDAPVTKFVLTMRGGKKGLLQNSTDLCASPQRAVARFDAQNSKLHDSRPTLKADCGAKRAHHRGARR